MSADNTAEFPIQVVLHYDSF